MRKKKRIIGLLGVGAILLTSMTGCVLPDEERYRSIDRTLEELDYTTIGEISKEYKSEGSGVFGPSYKQVFYADKKSFIELSNRLQEMNEECESNSKSTQMSCKYEGTSIEVYVNDFGTGLRIEDPWSGKNEK